MRYPGSERIRDFRFSILDWTTHTRLLMFRADRRFTVISSMLAGGFLAGFWTPPAIAQVSAPQIRTHFTPYALQRLSRDLNSPSNSENFFRVGREQFEQEIQRLRDPRSRPTKDVLKISPTIRLPQDSFPTRSSDNGSGTPNHSAS